MNGNIYGIVELMEDEITELREHIGAIEDERNLYIDFLEHLGYSALDAHEWRKSNDSA